MSTKNKHTFFLIAGEASGDILGARLMRALRQKLHGDVQFIGIGGPQMLSEGLDLFFPHTELMHFGLVEVIRHIPRLLKRIHQTTNEILRIKPDTLITIDSPDFCFRVAKKVKKNGNNNIPLIHYVAPTVWAWRAGRAKKIAKFLDHLLVLLPFEPPYFIREGLDCTFVGHSIIESDARNGSNVVFRAPRHIPVETPLLTLLPGSRTAEVNRLLPVFHDAVVLLKQKHPKLQIIVPVVPHLKERIENDLKTWGIPYHMVEGERPKYDAFAASRAALACSGTVALELALARLPAVIAYKMNALTVALFRRFVHVRYANLVNIMHNKMVVPEFLQENCTGLNLADAVDELLSNKMVREKQIAELVTTAQWLGQGKFVPSEQAADAILKAIDKTPEKDASTVHQPTILQIVPALVTGGVERGTIETVSALVKAGYRAIVASSGGPMVSEVEAAGGIHITLPLRSKNPFTIYANIERLSRIIREYKIDIVHARSRAPAWSAYAAAQKTHVFFVTTFHSAYGAGSKIKRWYNSVMGKGERVIAISDFVASYAELTYQTPHNIVRIIPRGVDIEKFDCTRVTAERKEALRRAWNLTEGAPLILMPGRLTRWKGQSVLIQALARLQRRDFVCIIVGAGKDSPYGQELLREIQRAQLEKNIAIVDTCRDMPAAYALSDIVIVPSTRPEGFGRVVIEAQAMGIPVIASDHGGAKETVIQGQTGWLTKPGDIEELANTMETILRMSSSERHAHGLRAQTHIRSHFTTEAMTTKTLAVYQELLSQPFSSHRPA